MSNIEKVALAQLKNVANQQSYNFVVDVDVDEAVCLNNPTRLTLPTYVEGADGEVVHPKVLFFTEKWNGYHYWMVITPYKNGSWAYENPSMLVSNDKMTWVEPPGITNPFIPAPTSPSGAFNADPYIFMDSTNSKMYLIYKYAETNSKQLRVCHTTDGIHWSTPVAIIITATEYVSPSVTWDGEKYTLWFIDVQNSNSFCCMTATDIYGTWGNKTNCVINIYPGNSIWHFDVIKCQNQYHMAALVIQTAGGENPYCGVYFAKSTDKINWNMSKTPILKKLLSVVTAWDNVNLYKPTMIPILNGDGIKYGLFYASVTKYYVGYTEIYFTKTKNSARHCNEVVAALNRLSPWILCDTFNRADSTVGLGTTDTGQTWVSQGGTLGISNKQAYATVPGISTIDISKSDFYLSFQIPQFTTGSECLVWFRKSGSGYWRFGLSGNAYKLFKYYNSASSTVVQGMGNPKAGDWLSLECQGSSIKCYINGILSCTIVDSDLSTATIIGVGISSTDVRFKNFIVRDLI